ncbi:hypothetical protein ACFQ0M_47365 [Kitasatospora aburaviensis]
MRGLRGRLHRSWWHTPRRVRGLTGLCVAALPTAGAVTTTVLAGVRDGSAEPGLPSAAQSEIDRSPAVKSRQVLRLRLPRPVRRRRGTPP